MLASPVNQSTNTEATAVTPTRPANILRLEFSGSKHEPVLLSPGKWNIGASASNQIILDNDGVAPRQFLIIVTEHRSVIKDWSADGLWNGRPFDSAVLGDGDRVEIAGVELSIGEGAGEVGDSMQISVESPTPPEKSPNCHETSLG